MWIMPDISQKLKLQQIMLLLRQKNHQIHFVKEQHWNKWYKAKVPLKKLHLHDHNVGSFVLKQKS